MSPSEGKYKLLFWVLLVINIIAAVVAWNKWPRIETVQREGCFYDVETIEKVQKGYIEVPSVKTDGTTVHFGPSQIYITTHVSEHETCAGCHDKRPNATRKIIKGAICPKWNDTTLFTE